LAQRDLNSIQNGWQIRHHLIRPEAQHAKAVALKPSGAARVVGGLFRFAMLAAINLDHQPCGKTNKIGKIGTQRELTAKSQPVDLFAPERVPKLPLGVRAVCTKLTRE